MSGYGADYSEGARVVNGAGKRIMILEPFQLTQRALGYIIKEL